MKYIIKNILREETQKKTLPQVILQDVIKTFTPEHLTSVGRDYQTDNWGIRVVRDDLNWYKPLTRIANNVIIPYIENTYGLNIIKDRDIIKPILLQWVRNIYGENKPLPGDTIEMISMEADWNPIKPGTKGVVDDISTKRFGGQYEEHLDVKWEDGRTLKVIIPGDEIKIVEKNVYV